MRILRMGVVMALLPVAAEAVEVGSGGVGLGGSWMSQKHGWAPGYQGGGIVDNGIVGPAAGGFLYVRIIGAFSAGLEATYSRKGFESTSPVTNAQGQIVGERTDPFTAHYLSVPVSARYELATRGGALYIFAGLSAEILMGHDDTEIFEHAKPVSLAGQAGVGLDWNRFGMNVRYVRDITDSFDPEPTFNLVSVKNYGVLGLATFAIWR